MLGTGIKIMTSQTIDSLTLALELLEQRIINMNLTPPPLYNFMELMKSFANCNESAGYHRGVLTILSNKSEVSLSIEEQEKLRDQWEISAKAYLNDIIEHLLKLK